MPLGKDVKKNIRELYRDNERSGKARGDRGRERSRDQIIAIAHAAAGRTNKAKGGKISRRGLLTGKTREPDVPLVETPPAPTGNLPAPIQQGGALERLANLPTEALNMPVSRRQVLEGAKKGAEAASMMGKLGKIADALEGAKSQAINPEVPKIDILEPVDYGTSDFVIGSFDEFKKTYPKLLPKEYNRLVELWDLTHDESGAWDEFGMSDIKSIVRLMAKLDPMEQEAKAREEQTLRQIREELEEEEYSETFVDSVNEFIQYLRDVGSGMWTGEKRTQIDPTLRVPPIHPSKQYFNDLIEAMNTATRQKNKDDYLGEIEKLKLIHGDYDSFRETLKNKAKGGRVTRPLVGGALAAYAMSPEEAEAAKLKRFKFHDPEFEGNVEDFLSSYPFDPVPDEWGSLRSNDAMIRGALRDARAGNMDWPVGLTLAGEDKELAGALSYLLPENNILDVQHLGSRVRGVGGELMRDLRTEFPRPAIELYSLHDAKPFYEKLGFVKAGRPFENSYRLPAGRPMAGQRPPPAGKKEFNPLVVQYYDGLIAKARNDDEKNIAIHDKREYLRRHGLLKADGGPVEQRSTQPVLDPETKRKFRKDLFKQLLAGFQTQWKSLDDEGRPTFNLDRRPGMVDELVSLPAIVTDKIGASNEAMDRINKLEEAIGRDLEVDEPEDLDEMFIRNLGIMAGQLPVALVSGPAALASRGLGGLRRMKQALSHPAVRYPAKALSTAGDFLGPFVKHHPVPLSVGAGIGTGLQLGLEKLAGEPESGPRYEAGGRLTARDPAMDPLTLSPDVHRMLAGLRDQQARFAKGGEVSRRGLFTGLLNRQKTPLVETPPAPTGNLPAVIPPPEAPTGNLPAPIQQGGALERLANLPTEALNMPVSRRQVLEGAKKGAEAASMMGKLGKIADLVGPTPASPVYDFGPAISSFAKKFGRMLEDPDVGGEKFWSYLDDVYYGESVDRSVLNPLFEETSKETGIPVQILIDKLGDMPDVSASLVNMARQLQEDTYKNVYHAFHGNRPWGSPPMSGEDAFKNWITDGKKDEGEFSLFVDNAVPGFKQDLNELSNDARSFWDDTWGVSGALNELSKELNKVRLKLSKVSSPKKAERLKKKEAEIQEVIDELSSQKPEDVD